MERARGRLVERRFFERDPVTVARELLGKVLVRREKGGDLAGRIVETEAYLGAEDPAAHTYHGETERNRVLFGPAGHAYVYFIYGVHYCLNFSCLHVGEPGCVLVRALEPIAGLEQMARNRSLAKVSVRSIASGPGRLCEALGITRERDNGKDVTARESDLQVWNDGLQVAEEDVLAGARVGITKAAELPLRFALRGSAFVSARMR